MKQLLRYLLNTILFIVLWGIMFLAPMKYSIDMGATSIAAIGGIIAIIISYRVVKRINKSNLWASLFDETELVNDVVEKKQPTEFLEKSVNLTTKSKKIISKGWLRLHIIFSLIMPIGYSIDTEIVYNFDIEIFLYAIIQPLVLYWLIVGIVVWVIRGFREDN
jgi:hypothetical protein